MYGVIFSQDDIRSTLQNDTTIKKNGCGTFVFRATVDNSVVIMEIWKCVKLRDSGAVICIWKPSTVIGCKHSWQTYGRWLSSCYTRIRWRISCRWFNACCAQASRKPCRTLSPAPEHASDIQYTCHSSALWKWAILRLTRWHTITLILRLQKPQEMKG